MWFSKRLVEESCELQVPKNSPCCIHRIQQNLVYLNRYWPMAALVDVDKMSHQDAAKAWLAAYEDVWKPFTE